MELGAFSISLAVADLSKSKVFYETLGFAATGGGEKWQIMVNGTTVIGLFEGMFPNNILTFNPGWGQDQSVLEEFTDVRELETALKVAGIAVTDATTGASKSGPASFVITDPDGNAILVDQHR